MLISENFVKYTHLRDQVLLQKLVPENLDSVKKLGGISRKISKEKKAIRARQISILPMRCSKIKIQMLWVLF